MRKIETRQIAGFETSALRVNIGTSTKLRLRTEFINDEDLFSVTIDEECIVIKRHGFGYTGRTNEMHSLHNFIVIHVQSDYLLDNGVFEFDEEESDSDNLVCYYKEQL